MSDDITIPGAPDNPYRAIAERYDYDADKTRCPSCGGLGMPWHGWFACERCRCVAVVEGGRAFVPVARETTEAKR
jgi:hypothetical protein